MAEALSLTQTAVIAHYASARRLQVCPPLLHPYNMCSIIRGVPQL